MLIIRPTTSLFKKLKLKPVTGSGSSKTVLGDWYVKDVVLGRKRFLLCMSSVTRLCIIMKAAPYKSFPERLSTSLEEVLEAIGIDPLAIKAELTEMSSYELYKTVDRSIIGSMTEASKTLSIYQSVEGLNLSDPLSISSMLNKIISSKLSWANPEEETLKTLGVKATKLSVVLSEPKKPHLYLVK